MSKNHHNQNKQSSAERNTAVYASHETEYQDIKKDLVRVVLLNSLILIAILAIYYTDKNSGYLQRFYDRIF